MREDKLITKESTSMSLPLIIMKLEIWSSSILLQIKRIEEAMHIINSGDISNEEKWHINKQRNTDEHFLKLAIEKNKEWLKELAEYTEEGEKWLKDINKKFPNKDLRNMAEHEVEYYKGMGNNQKSFIDARTGLNANQTGLLDDEYLVGGRLSLTFIKEYFDNLSKILKENRFTLKFEAISILHKIL